MREGGVLHDHPFEVGRIPDEGFLFHWIIEAMSLEACQIVGRDLRIHPVAEDRDLRLRIHSLLDADFEKVHDRIINGLQDRDVDECLSKFRIPVPLEGVPGPFSCFVRFVRRCKNSGGRRTAWHPGLFANTAVPPSSSTPAQTSRQEKDFFLEDLQLSKGQVEHSTDKPQDEGVQKGLTGCDKDDDMHQVYHEDESQKQKSADDIEDVDSLQISDAILSEGSDYFGETDEGTTSHVATGSGQKRRASLSPCRTKELKKVCFQEYWATSDNGLWFQNLRKKNIPTVFSLLAKFGGVDLLCWGRVGSQFPVMYQGSLIATVNVHLFICQTSYF